MDGQLLANVSRKAEVLILRVFSRSTAVFLRGILEYSQRNTPVLSKDIFVAGDIGFC